MERLFFFITILTLTSCRPKNKETLKSEDIIDTILKKRQIAYEEAFDFNYKNFDFRKLNDSSMFCARIKSIPTFGSAFIIEAHELKTFNGLFLTFKDPVVKNNFIDTVLLEPGLLFDQNCFWFEAANAIEIKNLFINYFKENSTDTSCAQCLHKSIYRVELFNYGTYSTIFKNRAYLSFNDSAFISKFNKLRASHKTGRNLFILEE